MSVRASLSISVYVCVGPCLCECRPMSMRVPICKSMPMCVSVSQYVCVCVYIRACVSARV